MNMIDLEQLKSIRDDLKTNEERYSRDRDMYQRGRQGQPESHGESLSERDMEMYQMGYSAYETLG